MNIYIVNLPYGTEESDINELFQEYGEVSSVKLIKDRATDRLKGFGFLEMEQSCGNKAIKDLNDFEFKGRKIVVNEARPKVERERSYNSRY